MMIITKEYGDDKASLMMTMMIITKECGNDNDDDDPNDADGDDESSTWSLPSLPCNELQWGGETWEEDRGDNDDDDDDDEDDGGARSSLCYDALLHKYILHCHAYPPPWPISKYEKVCASWMCHCNLDISVAPHRGRDSWPLQMIFGWWLFDDHWSLDDYTGCIKKMVLSDFSLKSVPGVIFYFFRGVLEPKFCAPTIWAL